MSTKPYSRYVYATDTEMYYLRGSKRPFSEATVLEKLRDIPGYAEKRAALDLLETIKALGQPYAVLFPSKVKLNLPTSIRTLYADLDLSIKILYSGNTPRLYLVSPNNEWKFWSTAGPEAFVDLVTSNGQLNNLFRSVYDGDLPEAAYIRSKLNFTGFISRIYDEFRSDSTHLTHAEPQLLSWDTAVPAYKQLDPTLLVAGRTPTWDEFLARVDLPEVFMAYTWSLFDPQNMGRQALWIYGAGHDGKSFVLNALLDFFGREHAFAMDQHSVQDTFFYGRIQGKRLGIYPDCNNPQILLSDKVKSFLGGDTVSINDKFEKPYTAQVYCKFYVASNKPPQINYSNDFERTRLLLIRVKKYDKEGGDRHFRANLVSELPAFLAKCKALYPKYYPTGMNMTVPKVMDDTIQTLCASMESEMLNDFIRTHIVFSPEGTCNKLDLHTRHVEVFGASKRIGQTTYSYEALVAQLMKLGAGVSKKDGIGCFTGFSLRTRDTGNILKFRT